jgi:phosphotriesterase-related protein
MHRRTFLGLIAALPTMHRLPAAGPSATIQTVLGPIDSSTLGVTLPHEHVLVDFVGAQAVSSDRYEADDVFATVLPHLQAAHRRGVRALIECTPAFLARDPRLLARLSAATGLHLLTNTGLYGARQNQFLPEYAHTESAHELADRWIAEWRDGIDGTGIRPGFIKCGVDPEPALSPLHHKLVTAAALSHRETGLAVAVHTGRGPGLAQLTILQAHGVAASAFIWVHAQNAPEDDLLTAARQGAWISLDGLAPTSAARHRHLCEVMKEHDLLSRVLLSHDAGWYDPAKPGGGDYRGYTFLFDGFLPSLRQTGFSNAEIDDLIRGNPARAFTVAPRLL